MKYEFRVIEIKDLDEGDRVDIPDGSLILGETTTSEQGYIIHNPNKTANFKTEYCFITRIKVLVPIRT